MNKKHKVIVFFALISLTILYLLNGKVSDENKTLKWIHKNGGHAELEGHPKLIQNSPTIIKLFFDKFIPQKIEAVIINNNNVVDINEISDLGGIAFLDISHTSISTIDPLENLPLISLNISNTKVSDIHIINTLEKLEYLDISNIQVRDVSSLKKRESLKEIKVSNQNIKEELNKVFPNANIIVTNDLLLE